MMGHNIQSGSGDAAMMQQMHVKMETVDENATAFVLGSQESSAPCEESAAYCTYTADGEACPSPTDNLELADTQHAGSTILLYPVSTERYFPASASEKTFAHSSDFCSKAVMYLIEGIGRRWGLYETRERSQLFQSVQDEMAAKGYVLPVEKIRRKWNNLIVTYKRVKDRSREMGHAKTSWEFFDLMDATLCDTVGAQVMHSSKSKKTSKANPTGSVPLLKIAAKPHVSEPGAPDIPPYGDFTTPAVVKSMTHAATAGAHINNEISSAATVPVTSVSLETTAPELKPLILLNGDITTASIQPAALSPCLVSSAYATETLPPDPSHSFELTNNHAHPRVKIRSGARLKAPLLRSGAAGRRGRGQEGRTPPQPSQRNNHNIHALSSSLPSTFSSHSPFPTSSYDASRTDGQTQMDTAEQGGSTSSLLQEVLRRQEEQAYLEQAAGRRADARERRRERREVRMAESLGRIATALELLSSKQDTVIALLQRLAERK